MNILLKTMIPVVSIVIVLFLLFRPVCVELNEEDIRRFYPPIENRTDKNFYLNTFQKKENKWYQCKT